MVQRYQESSQNREHEIPDTGPVSHPAGNAVNAVSARQRGELKPEVGVADA